VGTIFAVLVALTALVSFYIARVKEAEARGKFYQQFDQLKVEVDRHEGRIAGLIGGQEELERSFLEQSMILKHLGEKLDEISRDLKELVREHNCAQRRGEP
jgi:truncated hemoglobin YjbI